MSTTSIALLAVQNNDSALTYVRGDFRDIRPLVLFVLQSNGEAFVGGHGRLTDTHSISGTRRAILDAIPVEMRERIKNWTEKRAEFLAKNPDLEKAADTCSISRDNIYDRAILEENDQSFSFERSSLLSWLLTNPTNPLTNQLVSVETIIKLFLDAGEAAPNIDGKEK